MQGFLAVCALLAATVGHVAMCIAAVNRLHAFKLPCRILRTLTAILQMAMVAAPLLFCTVAWFGVDAAADLFFSSHAPPLLRWYLGGCVAVAAVGLPWSVVQRLSTRPAGVLLSNRSSSVDVARRLGHRPLGRTVRAPLAYLPGNDAFRVEVNQKQLECPRLPEALDSTVVAHFSDLHFCGTILPEFFEQVVDLVNDVQADVVALTGDLVDKTHCLGWIDRVLGRLKEPSRIFFVLGNHDRRVDAADLLRRLAAVGVVHVGGRSCDITIRGHTVTIAGNAWPWFGPRPAMEPFDTSAPRRLRILLSHSPDQLRWARRHQFDLMLAGHTHGGQIRLPRFGPIFAPSLYGVKYASGVFYEPPTVMHVSRGVSGVMPIRWNCPPEITRLVLRCPKSVSTSDRPSGRVASGIPAGGG